MSNWVDVTGGRFRLDEIEREIISIAHIYKPKRIIVDIKAKPGGWYATFYISKEDFGKKEE